MHNSARMLFRDFIFLCLANGSFELEIGSGTLLCAHYAHNICAAGPLWKFLCAHLSVWEQRPDLLIADNQCSVIVTNCTKIVSSENLIKIRIRYKYDKKGSFWLCSLWDGKNKINWRKIQLKLPWWPLTMMEQRGLITFCTTFSQVFKRLQKAVEFILWESWLLQPPYPNATTIQLITANLWVSIPVDLIKRVMKNIRKSKS